NADGASFRADWLLSHEAMAEAREGRARADDPIRRERAGGFRLKDVEIFLGGVGEGAFGGAAVFGEHLFGNVRARIDDHEGLVLIEVAIVEDEQELRSLARESLKRVGDAAREIPDVTLSQIILEGVTVLVDRSDPHPTFDHKTPFVWLMPVHFPDCASLEPHV